MVGHYFEDSTGNDEENPLLLHDTHLEIWDNLEFWKSIRSLSLQEKSLYTDLDYSRGRVSLRKEKTISILRHLRKISFILFSFSLAFDYIYTTYKAITNNLWDVLFVCNCVFSVLVLCLVCKEPVRLMGFGVIFVILRMKASKVNRQYSVILSFNTMRIFMSSISFFFLFYIFDQIIELIKTK